MSHDAIDNWVERAKQVEASSQAESNGVQIVRRIDPRQRGNLIMAISEKLRPWLLQVFEGARDADGMLLQPAHVRGIALNVAQSIVQEYENRAA